MQKIFAVKKRDNCENIASLLNFSKTNFQKKSKIFMIRKDSSFCNQILQAAAILDKKLKTLILLLILFFVNISPCLNQIYYFFLDLRSYIGSEN